MNRLQKLSACDWVVRTLTPSRLFVTNVYSATFLQEIKAEITEKYKSEMTFGLQRRNCWNRLKSENVSYEQTESADAQCPQRKTHTLITTHTLFMRSNFVHFLRSNFPSVWLLLQTVISNDSQNALQRPSEINDPQQSEPIQVYN